ncbi:MAG: ABC transporter, partial [Actinomycetota bacterium]
AGGLLGLDDPARDLLAATPTTLARRRAHRLALLVPAVAASGAALVLIGHEAGLVGGPVGSLAGSLLALGAVGLLVARLVERRRPELTAAAGAGAPVTWVLTAAAGPGSGALGALTHGWADHPWSWAAAAALAWVAACRRQPT